MTHAEQIILAVAELAGFNRDVILSREAIRDQARISPETWVASYSPIFQGMRCDQPGGAPKVGQKYKNVFKRVSHGKYCLTDYGWKLVNMERQPAVAPNHSKQTVIVIENHHIASCGIPPDFTQLPHDYKGYYESDLGDQFVFLFDKKTKTGTLFCGNANWTEPVIISAGQTLKIVLSELEQAWLTACWMTCHMANRMIAPPLQFYKPFDKSS